MDIGKLEVAAPIYDGQWVKDIPGLGDARLKVRGLSSPQARKLRNRLFASEGVAGEKLTDEAVERIASQVALKALLLDWEGFTEHGQPVPYDATLAEIWLTDPKFAVFADAVIIAASRVDALEEKYFVDVTKN